MKNFLAIMALSIGLSQAAFAEIKVGDAAPCDIKLKMLMRDGSEKEQSVCDAPAGQKVVIDFFATWCHFCVQALPNFEKEAAANPNTTFRIVSTDADRATMDKYFSKRDRKNYDIAYDTEDTGGKFSQAFQIEGLPTTAIIGKDKKVKFIYAGAFYDANGKPYDQSVIDQFEAALKAE